MVILTVDRAIVLIKVLDRFTHYYQGQKCSSVIAVSNTVVVIPDESSADSSKQNKTFLP